MYLLLLLSVTLWYPGHCQDINKLMIKSQETQVHQAFMKNPSIHHEFLEVINKLWTEYLPEIIDNDQITGFTQECRNSTRSILTGNLNQTISEILVLLDATAKQGAGLFSGNVFLNGAFDECFEHEFTGYCVAYGITPKILPQNSTLKWTIGLCIPKYCTASDVVLLMNLTRMFWPVNETLVKCEDSKGPSYSPGAVIMIIVCVIFVLLVMAGTIIDCIVENTPYFFEEAVFPINSSPAVNHHNPSSESSETVPLLTYSVKDPKWKSHLWELATAFSLFKTVPTLLATKQAPTVITSLNGIRVISMCWVILCHTHLWSFMVGLDNPVKIRKVGSRLSFQAVINAFFSVDSFFFLSGVLVSYLTLREMKKKKGRFPFIHYYIHRYLRLTPSYAFVLFFSWSLTYHLAYGPALSLPMVDPNAQCSKYWWTNLLYINNFYPWKLSDECIGWGWYLANDMQFYIISPLILIPAYFLFPVGLAIALIILVCGFITTAVIAGVFDLQANLFANIAYNYSTTKTVPDFQDVLYVKPWARISPYIVGLVLGYVLYRGFRLQFGRKVNTLLYLLLWVASGIILGFCLYGLIFTWHGHVPTKFENVVYITFSRFGWGIGLALIVFACHNGYGWFINSFLSMKIWTPLSRMSYNAYLVHPVILTVVFGQLQITIHYTDITMALFTLGIVMLSYGVAGVVCLFVELPLGTVEMVIFKLLGMKNRETRQQRVEGNNGE